jgi:hypothetical protein
MRKAALAGCGVLFLFAGCTDPKPLTDHQADSLPQFYAGTQEYLVEVPAMFTFDFKVSKGTMNVFLIPGDQASTFMAGTSAFTFYSGFSALDTQRFANRAEFVEGNVALAYLCLGEGGCDFSFDVSITADSSIDRSPNLETGQPPRIRQYLFKDEQESVASGYYFTQGFEVQKPGTTLSYSVRLPTGMNADVCLGPQGSTEKWANEEVATTFDCRQDTYLAEGATTLNEGTYELGVYCDQESTCPITFSLMVE